MRLYAVATRMSHLEGAVLAATHKQAAVRRPGNLQRKLGCLCRSAFKVGSSGI